jgi:hypothetical protein
VVEPVKSAKRSGDPLGRQIHEHGPEAGASDQHIVGRKREAGLVVVTFRRKGTDSMAERKCASVKYLAYLRWGQAREVEAGGNQHARVPLP